MQVHILWSQKTSALFMVTDDHNKEHKPLATSEASLSAEFSAWNPVQEFCGGFCLALSDDCSLQTSAFPHTHTHTHTHTFLSPGAWLARHSSKQPVEGRDGYLRHRERVVLSVVRSDGTIKHVEMFATTRCAAHEDDVFKVKDGELSSQQAVVILGSGAGSRRERFRGERSRYVLRSACGFSPPIGGFTEGARLTRAVSRGAIKRRF